MVFGIILKNMFSIVVANASKTRKNERNHGVKSDKFDVKFLQFLYPEACWVFIHIHVEEALIEI